MTQIKDEMILQVNNLRTSFRTRDGEVAAVNGLSLQVSAGEILGLVGESGCGKSTTLHAIMRLIPHPGQIIGGEILFDGQNLAALRESEMRRVRGAKIGMIFQDALASLDPTMKIGEQLMEPLLLHQRMKKPEARARALELLKMVGISSPEQRMKQYIHEFSGGMRQRIMSAIALSCNPRLLLADEPTTALDVTVQKQILDLIVELRDRVGAGIVFITHDVGVVSEICDTVVVMYAGREMERGSTRRVFTLPRHPYTKGLLGSTLDAHWDKEKALHAIPGLPPDLINLPKGCVFAPRCNHATDRCRQSEPPLEEVGEGQQVACWHWREE